MRESERQLHWQITLIIQIMSASLKQLLNKPTHIPSHWNDKFNFDTVLNNDAQVFLLCWIIDS